MNFHNCRTGTVVSTPNQKAAKQGEYSSPLLTLEAKNKATANGKAKISDEWREKIAALGAKHGSEYAQWARDGRRTDQGDVLNQRQRGEIQTLYKEYIKAHGGTVGNEDADHGREGLTHDEVDKILAEARYRNKYNAAWDEVFDSAYQTELCKKDIVRGSEGGDASFKIIDSSQGTLDVLS